MMGRWLLLVILVIGLFVPMGRGAMAQTDRASGVIAEVNAYRAALGLSALQTHPSLMLAAQLHVDWMVRTGQYGHTGEGGTAPADRAKAAGYPTVGYYVYENWVGGGNMTPFEAVAWWDGSPVHQNTLRLQGFEHIGAGYADDGGRSVYVLLIAKPSSPPASASGSGASDQRTASSGSSGGGGGPADNPDSAEAVSGEEPAEPAVVMVPVVRSEPGEDGSIVHEVQQGQTVWTIAAVYDVNLMDLVVINNLGPDAIIKPGDRVIVKLAEGQSPPPAPTTHTVLEGETAWTIAALHGLTLDDLLNLNGITRSTVLYPGDTVRIRQPDPTATPTEIASITPTPAPRPTRSDMTLAPTWTLSPTWSPTPEPPPATLTATPTPAPPIRRAGAHGSQGPDRALLASLGVAGVGFALLAGGVWLARRRGNW